MTGEFRRFTICGYDRAHGMSSGTAVGLVSLARWFANRGIVVQVLMLHLGEASDCPFIQTLLIAGDIRCETLSMDRYPDAARQTRWILDRVRDFKPDLFCPNYAAPGIFAARNLGQAGVPIVVVLHSTGVHTESVVALLQSGYLDPPPMLVAVSRYIADRAASRLGPARCRGVSVISCGTSVPDRHVAEAPVHGIQVLYTGRFLQRGKRIRDVADAMLAICAAVESACCKMIGDGPEWEAVRDHVRARDHTGRVSVLPAVPNEQIHEHLLGAHVFLLLSEYEGLSVSLMEAMAVGLVPIGPSDVPGIAEVISNDENGILVCDRNAAVVAAVRALADNPDLWSRLSREARKTIIDRYSLDVENEKWLACCRELCHESRAWVRQPSRRICLPDVPLAEGDIRRPPLKERLRWRARNAVMAVRSAIRPRARLRALRNRWSA